jgi:hypothetical protein|tara:strand:- start:180 stop:356 length:177 start_codon:yes stop_codon:yes gene_type:complete
MSELKKEFCVTKTFTTVERAYVKANSWEEAEESALLNDSTEWEEVSAEITKVEAEESA